MIKIIFRNLEKSELAREVTEERLYPVFERFENLKQSQITVTLSMENSPTQAGPDVFTVKFHSHGGRYNDVVLQKSAASLYVALSDLVDHLLERLNRYGDKMRVKNLKKARQAKEMYYDGASAYERIEE